MTLTSFNEYQLYLNYNFCLRSWSMQLYDEIIPGKHGSCGRLKCNNFHKFNKVLNLITFGTKCNYTSMQSFNCASVLLLQRTFKLRCLSDGCCIKESSDQYSWHIAGSLILFSVFLFAKDVDRQALVTNLIYIDMLLASNRQTSKQ